MKIFLFDMDGVLLESQGYHRALQETVRRMALALGFEDGTISAGEIAAFEAGGISSEWDEAAIITAALLEQVWKEDPHRGLPDSLAGTIRLLPNPRPLPDILKLAHSLSTPALLPLHPLERAARLFFHKEGRTDQQEQLLHDLILGARMADLSLTHRTFQELVLGSEVFSQAYAFRAEHGCESYLLKYDHSNLPDEAVSRLRDWISAEGQAAAVITSRPSNAASGVFSTPEAELGAKLVGLDGIPIVGWGGMCWLGLQTHINPQSFLKPSPVHALAGMRAAMSESQEIALTEAADLVENGIAVADWENFRDAKISVFEDAPGGIKSLQAASQVLRKMGIPINAKYYGIARERIKVDALMASSAQIYPSLVEALEAAY
jgi:hypothetical protein